MYTIYVDGANILTGEMRTAEVFDLILNRSSGPLSVIGSGNPVPVEIGVNDSGYGEIKYRNITNNSPWINVSFVNDQQHIHL
ncbi:protein of unknown function [Paraburkholderia kururiensis]|uniref:hypothetical protein n=1 Tax=Paraburkholderia kururiensis TaxID=984307 RepID=UPI0039A52719